MTNYRYYTNIHDLLKVESPCGMICKDPTHFMHYIIERTFQHCEYSLFHISDGYVTW